MHDGHVLLQLCQTWAAQGPAILKGHLSCWTDQHGIRQLLSFACSCRQNVKTSWLKSCGTLLAQLAASMLCVLVYVYNICTMREQSHPLQRQM